MTATIGVNTFVWYSPLTDEGLRTIIPRVAGWGFETIELVLENAGDWDPQLAADLVREHGIQPRSGRRAARPQHRGSRR